MLSLMNRIDIILLTSIVFVLVYQIEITYSQDDDDDSSMPDYIPANSELDFGGDIIPDDSLVRLHASLPGTTFSFRDMSDLITNSRLQDDVYEVQFTSKIITYLKNTIVIGQLSNINQISTVQFIFCNDNDDIVQDSFGNLMQYTSIPRDFGHVLDILYQEFTFSYTKCLLKLKPNSNFDPNSLFFHCTHALSSLTNSTEMITGPISFSIDSPEQIYNTSINCPSGIICMWLLDNKVISNTRNTTVTLTFDWSNIGNRTLSYVGYNGNNPQILASLSLSILPSTLQDPTTNELATIVMTISSIIVSSTAPVTTTEVTTSITSTSSTTNTSSTTSTSSTSSTTSTSSPTSTSSTTSTTTEVTTTTTTASTTNEVITTTTVVDTTTTTESCFFGEDKVRLVNGDIKTISKLRSGMKVYSMNSRNEIVKDEIIMILHREPNETAILCVIETSDPRYQLSVTCDHYVAVSDGSKTQYLISDHIKAGEHFVYVADDLHYQLRLVQVTNVIRQYKTGLYGLTTNEGTLVINNIVASCYTNYTTIRTVHNILGLFRLYYKLAKCFSVGEPFETPTSGLPKSIEFLKDRATIVIIVHDLIVNIIPLVEIVVLVIIGYLIQIILQKIPK